MAGNYRLPPTQMSADTWGSMSDYDHALMRQLQREVENQWEFMAWLKMTHPEALQEWKAIQKIKES